jgi:very-short-patch-repair endonuclease
MAVFTADKRTSAIFAPPRVVVWGVPAADALAEASTALFGDTERAQAFSLDLRVPMALPSFPKSPTRAVLWLAGTPASAEVARSLLYDLVRPLLHQTSEFVVGFEHPRERITPAYIGRDERWHLDVEDAIGLLEADAVAEQFAQLHLLRTRVAMTPIEEQLAAAFEREGVRAEPQVRFGPFTVDFLVSENGSKFAVEADGADFHDADRDRERDATLRGLGITDVLRFTGSEIYTDADRCANRVKERLQGALRQAPSPARQTLDASQTLAVQHAGGAARVLAPAGAGKTRVLVNRIAELIERGVEPSSILALAFNKKAQEQMTAALKGELRIGVAQRKVYDRSDPGVRVVTFNAFGRRTLDERFGYAPTPTSDGALRNAMEKAVRDAGTDLAGSLRGSDPLGRFLEARARVVADLRPADAEHIELERVKAPTVVIPYEPVNQAFEAELVRRGICGFDDQIGDTVTRLLADREQRVYVQNFFTHVLVDEFQDLNPSQLALLDIVDRMRSSSPSATTTS